MVNKSAITFFCCISAFYIFNGSSCRKDSNCPEENHQIIIVKNNSSVVVNWIRNDNANDSVWRQNGSPFPEKTYGLIDQNSTIESKAGKWKCWEHYYSGEHQEYYFIFDHDTVESIGWEAIHGTNRGLLKRITVNLNYLQQNNFTVTYP